MADDGKNVLRPPGRKPGRPSKTTFSARAEAARNAPVALKELARIAKHGQRESDRVRACVEILDRAYGKPKHFFATEDDDKITIVVKQFVAPVLKALDGDN